jgi:hypothetical protein
MGKEQHAFFKQLDELIHLFEELKEKAEKEGMTLTNDPLYQNFELLSTNYKLIKNTIPPELIEEIGEPIKEIIGEMLTHLKEVLHQEDSDPESSFKKELDDIDKLLSSGKLSEDEINTLLDRRQELEG